MKTSRELMERLNDLKVWRKLALQELVLDQCGDLDIETVSRVLRLDIQSSRLMVQTASRECTSL